MDGISKIMKDLRSHHEALKRWDEKGGLYSSTMPFYTRFSGGVGASALPASVSPIPRKLPELSSLDDDMASTMIPSVTVVLEGRSIGHLIYLHKHAGYESFAMALRRMFVDTEGEDSGGENAVDGLNLSNAVPGYLVAYEDMEDDLLLAGDLDWKDFVRVAKRIRIIPAKTSRRKHCVGALNKSSSY